MGKGKKDFYLVQRKDRLTKGLNGKRKPTFYCRFRDQSTGELLAWQSTGETSKARAENWALGKLKKDAPLTSSTLNAFAKDFFRWESSSWILRQHAKGRRFSESVARGRQGHLDNYILPKFGPRGLAELNQKAIEDWLASLELSNQSRNHILYTFRIILREAKLGGLINISPLAEVEAFGVNWKRRDVFTLAELHRLFPADAKKLIHVWGDHEHATAFLLLADTGMRSGECRGLRWLNVIQGKALYIDSALDKAGRVKGTKTDTSRLVPISTKAQSALQLWNRTSDWSEPDDFIFSEGKGQPHGDKWLIRALPKAFKHASIQVGDRNLVVHSFRHTYITLMDSLVKAELARALSGHATEKARKIYTHPSVEDMLSKLGPAQKALEKLWKVDR